MDTWNPSTTYRHVECGHIDSPPYCKTIHPFLLHFNPPGRHDCDSISPVGRTALSGDSLNKQFNALPIFLVYDIHDLTRQALIQGIDHLLHGNFLLDGGHEARTHSQAHIYQMNR
jgi:hypothetical protein